MTQVEPNEEVPMSKVDQEIRSSRSNGGVRQGERVNRGQGANAGGLPPGPRLPKSLQTLRWLVDGPRFMERCQERYGDIFSITIVSALTVGAASTREANPIVFLSDPEDIKRVFTSDPDVVRTGETNSFLLPVVGPESILVLDEPEHMQQRKLMLPPFHGQRIAGYEELMAEVTLAELERWPVGRSFPVWPSMQAITLEVIVRAVFGITEAHEIGRFESLLTRMLNEMTSLPFLIRQVARAMVSGGQGGDVTDRAGKLPRVRRLLDPVDAAIYEEISRRRAASDIAEREDILSALMEARFEDGSGLSDKQLRDELITLLIAGHESTATMLAWAFERLLRHPEKLERVRDEATAGENAYAEAVVQETLRLRPVIPLVLRKLAAPFEVGGYTLPAGTWIGPCAYLVQRNGDVYHEPKKFLPERFLDKAPPTYAWTPFGGGVRRCVGASFAQLEMRVVLQTVLRHVALETEAARSERIRRRFITFSPSRGGQVRVTGRRTAQARAGAVSAA